MRRSVRTATIGAVSAFVLLLSSCTASDASDASPHDLLGKTLEDARSSFPDDTTVIIQDASPRVGRAASYRDELNDGGWTIVSACSSAELLSDSESIEVAVIPTGSLTSAISQRIEDGDFRDAVTGCDG